MNRRLFFLLISVAALVRFILAPLVWHPDLNNHVDWGIKFFEYGTRSFYAPESNVWAYTWPNQPPGTIYIFAIVRKVYEIIFNLSWSVNISIPVFPSVVMTWVDEKLYQSLLKLPAILADFGLAYLIYKFIKLLSKSTKRAYLGAFLFLLNPVVWYNSAVWGQSDSTINFFALLALYLVCVRKPIAAILVFSVCIFIKISLLVFLPVFIILLIRNHYSLAQLGKGVLLSLVVIGLLAAPFAYENNVYIWIYDLYAEKILVNQLQIITANAFNFWAIVAGIHEQPHTKELFLFNYQSWGNIVFFTLYVPVVYKLWKNPSAKIGIWALALTAFTSWMFMTNMHERYLYPLFPYLTILVAVNIKLLAPYVLISTINLLNLYNFWWVPEISFIREFLSFGNRLTPRILGGVNTILYIMVYRKFLKVNEKN